MRTIFVVEQGSYSDYGVVGVYTTKENADAIAAKINESDPYDEATVAEWPLDPGIDALRSGLDKFSVLMLRDGAVEEVRKLDDGWTFDISGGAHIWRRTQARAYKGRGIPDCLSATVWAKDEKHAVKIANERRAEMIASGEWAA
jgi:hypothetical protein